MGRVAISYNPEKHLRCATPSKSLAQNNFLCTKYSKHFLNRNVEPTDQEEPRNCTRGLQPQPLFLYSRKETISWSLCPCLWRFCCQHGARSQFRSFWSWWLNSTLTSKNGKIGLHVYRNMFLDVIWMQYYAYMYGYLNGSHLQGSWK